MVSYAILHTGLYFVMDIVGFVYCVMQAGDMRFRPVSFLFTHTYILQHGSVVSDISISVGNKPTRCHFCVILYFLLYKLLNMFWATMCPFSGDDD